ncbi:MAG: hypothetical protein QNL04_05705 [SAR324 cluster bacterium]|nr:hypothetical protein [SAR324 cluster bacterium]
MDEKKPETLFGADIAWAPYFFTAVAAVTMIITLIVVSSGH